MLNNKLKLVKMKIKEEQIHAQEKLNQTMELDYVYRKEDLIAFYKGITVAYENIYDYVDSV